MAVTILQRPEGHILEANPTVCQGFNFASGFVQWNFPAHGLNDGDIVYISSTITDYNGFVEAWPSLTGDPTNYFATREIGSSTNIPFFQSINSEIQRSILDHGWSAVHLPITYKLSTNLYPTNSSDTSRNINSVQDANGYTVLQLSGSLGTVHTYDFVKITLPNDTELSGVYQILEFISPTVILINLEYDTTNDFTSATALKHYNNYNILVRVYAGINASHEWTAQKPYELAATLKFIPDSDNEVFFSINELLKSYIETRNNLVLATLPNNIDFWTNFYIEVAESYDDSDGYTFGTFTSAYTSDQSNFEGVAVNAKLPFKNIYSGYLSEYLMTNNTAKFLTLFTIPVLFSCGDDTPDCYSDISFLNPYDSIPLILRQQYSSSSGSSTTVDVNLGTPDSGVIRAELSPDCSYDEMYASVVQTNSIDDLEDFINGPAGTSDWVVGIPAPTNNLAAGVTTKNLLGEATLISGLTYTINYSITRVGGTGFPTGTIVFRTTSGGADIATSGVIALPVGVTVGSFQITPSAQINYVSLSITNPAGGTKDFTLNLLTSDNLTISETKQFKIDCGCAMQEIRLTWLNNLGGFDYWAFTAHADHIREIQEAVTTKKNILPTWPKSYGADADTIKKQTLRVSNKAYTVRSQHLTEDEADALSYIKSSILVQIINSRTDRRTVLVDTDSFIVRKDGDKTFEVAFNISFTDDIAVQTT